MPVEKKSKEPPLRGYRPPATSSHTYFEVIDSMEMQFEYVLEDEDEEITNVSAFMRDEEFASARGLPPLSKARQGYVKVTYGARPSTKLFTHGKEHSYARPNNHFPVDIEEKEAEEVIEEGLHTAVVTTVQSFYHDHEQKTVIVETSDSVEEDTVQSGDDKRCAYVRPNNHIPLELQNVKAQQETVPIVIFYPQNGNAPEESAASTPPLSALQTIRRQDGRCIPMVAKTVNLPIDVARSMLRSCLNTSLRNKAPPEPENKRTRASDEPEDADA